MFGVLGLGLHFVCDPRAVCHVCGGGSSSEGGEDRLGSAQHVARGGWELGEVRKLCPMGGNHKK